MRNVKFNLLKNMSLYYTIEMRMIQILYNDSSQEVKKIFRQ